MRHARDGDDDATGEAKKEEERELEHDFCGGNEKEARESDRRAPRSIDQYEV